MDSSIKKNVQEYYGSSLQKTSDLQTNACCDPSGMPKFVKEILSQVHDEVISRYYGCGLILPEDLAGRRILDLGSGAGRDCYILSKLVGQDGHITGVDMTQEQLEVARTHIDYHTKKFGYAKPNIDFIEGDLDKLNEIALSQDSFDIVVSNCVVNLVQDKLKLLQDVYGLLKKGGEIYFSDVYASRRIPEETRKHPVLYSECLGGALYWNDFLNIAKKAGFFDPRLVTSAPITIENPELEALVPNVEFYSMTYRLFKLPELEPACEDYGQAVVYKGTIPYHKHFFFLDSHHVIEKGRMFPVCGNTYNMLRQSRLQSHFEFYGNFDTHYGIYEGCGTIPPYSNATAFSQEGSSSESCC